MRCLPKQFHCLILVLIMGCGPRLSTQSVVALSSEIPKDERFIMLHLSNGKVALLKSWELDTVNLCFIGDADIYSLSRSGNKRSVKEFKFDFDEIVLVETNDTSGSSFRASDFFMTLSILTSAITVPCVFDPKACFGSCPTFYSIQDDSLIIQAEGFSSSITRSLESVDIDRLANLQSTKADQIEIVLKNEAYETHYINTIELLAAEKNPEEQVYSDGENFYSVEEKSSPISSSNGELSYFLSQDGMEYFSMADSTDLVAKESIVLDFEPVESTNLGVLITKRQSLMTTFLFYQSLAFMGSRAGQLMSQYERSSDVIKKFQKDIYQSLGGIEIEVRIDDKWRKIGSVNEQGPIVSDSHLLRIDEKGSIDKIRLTFSQGLWRIDEVALARISGEKEVVAIKPSKVNANRVPGGNALGKLLDRERYLVTQPGDSYKLIFDLPKSGTCAFFIRSKGYYTEWIRKEWLAEEDMKMVELMIQSPDKWLKLMAPKYKLQEHSMEEYFWSSKYNPAHE